MNLLKFLRWLKGYLSVEIRGEYCSLFLSFLIKSGIKVWDVSTNKKAIVFKIKYKDYFKIFSLRHLFKENVSVKQVKKFGFPFKTRKFLRRKSLLVGFIFFFMVLFVLSRFIWTIDIVGNESVVKAEIVDAYTQLGVKIGMPASKINSYSLRDKLPLLVREISWCSFNLEGTKLTINITEIKETDKSDKEQYSNIIALCDGVISHIDIISGNKVIKVGDVVKKGEILVSGAPELNSQKFTYSNAEILAKTSREFKIIVSKENIREEKTGVVKRKRIINFFGFKIPLFLDNIHFKNTSIKDEKYLCFIRSELPISIIYRDYLEVNLINEQIDDDLALQNAKANLIKELKKYDIEQIENINISVIERNHEFEFKFVCNCVENIAKNQKINVTS